MLPGRDAGGRGPDWPMRLLLFTNLSISLAAGLVTADSYVRLGHAPRAFPVPLLVFFATLVVFNLDRLVHGADEDTMESLRPPPLGHPPPPGPVRPHGCRGPGRGLVPRRRELDAGPGAGAPRRRVPGLRPPRGSPTRPRRPDAPQGGAGPARNLRHTPRPPGPRPPWSCRPSRSTPRWGAPPGSPPSASSSSSPSASPSTSGTSTGTGQWQSRSLPAILGLPATRILGVATLVGAAALAASRYGSPPPAPPGPWSPPTRWPSASSPP